jgi:hypothetical protein
MGEAPDFDGSLIGHARPNRKVSSKVESVSGMVGT